MTPPLAKISASHNRPLAYEALLLALFLLSAPATAAAQNASPFPVIGKPAPDFALTDQTGRRVRLSQFRGKLVLLNFIYTHCTDVCPLTTAALLRVQKDLIQRGWWAKDVVFLSVTTDPERDTSAVLHTYAKRYQADARGWHFLTGPLRTVQEIHRRYGIEVRPRGQGLQDHHLPTFAIDRNGVVLGAYGVNPDPEAVLSDMEVLMKRR